jgi:hypothetical protein
MSVFDLGIVEGMQKIAAPTQTMYFVEGQQILAMDEQPRRGIWGRMGMTSASKHRPVTGDEAKKARAEARRLAATVVLKKRDGQFTKLALFGFGKKLKNKVGDPVTDYLKNELREGGGQAGDEFRRRAMPTSRQIKRTMHAAGDELPGVIKGALKKTWLPIAGVAGVAGLSLGLGSAIGRRAVRPDPATYYHPMQSHPAPLVPAGAPSRGVR